MSLEVQSRCDGLAVACSIAIRAVRAEHEVISNLECSVVGERAGVPYCEAGGIAVPLISCCERITNFRTQVLATGFEGERFSPGSSAYGC